MKHNLIIGAIIILMFIVVGSYVWAIPPNNSTFVGCPQYSLGSYNVVEIKATVAGRTPIQIEHEIIHEYGHYLYDLNYPNSAGSSQSEAYAQEYEATHRILEAGNYGK